MRYCLLLQFSYCNLFVHQVRIAMVANTVEHEGDLIGNTRMSESNIKNNGHTVVSYFDVFFQLVIYHLIFSKWMS